MFKALSAFAALAIPANAIVDDLAETQCHAVITDNLTTFNLQGLERIVGDYSESAGSDVFTFNYCTFVEGTSAYATLTTGGDVINIATDPVMPTNAEVIRKDGEITGVEVKQTSDTDCGADQYEMVTKIMCDDGVTGAPDFVSLDISGDGCTYTVELKHEDGCPALGIDLQGYISWLEENEWFLGIMYLIVGPLLGLFGVQWFPYVTAILVAFFVFGLCVSLGLAFDWMVTTGGLIAVLVVGAILGTLLGIFIKRKIWIMVALLGMVAGFFSGTLIFALIASASGWTAAWGWWVISIIMAIVGTLLAYGLGRPVVLTATSFVGSYLFVRAWTLFFPGHWPSEAQLMSDYDSVETDSIFWVFVSLLIISIIGSICFQTKRGKVHKDLDDAFQRAE